MHIKNELKKGGHKAVFVELMASRSARGQLNAAAALSSVNSFESVLGSQQKRESS